MLVANSTTQNSIAEESLSMEEKENVGKAIGRIASGVFIVTTERDGNRDGLLASWISQAAFEPPMVSVAVQKSRHLLELLGVGQRFTVNILSKDNTGLFKNFAKPFEPGLDRFEGLALAQQGKSGPILADAIAFLDCVTRTMVETGDHVLVVGEIINGQLLNPEKEPLVHLRKNGFQY
jgi:flavin reductase (DIM6/NTAB) family NADH-FMN oxidoreductase RutF